MNELFDDIIEHRIGYGDCQRRWIAIFSFFWMLDSSELMIQGFLHPMLEKKWDIHEDKLRQLFFRFTNLQYSHLIGFFKLGHWRSMLRVSRRYLRKSSPCSCFIKRNFNFWNTLCFYDYLQ